MSGKLVSSIYDGPSSFHTPSFSKSAMKKNKGASSGIRSKMASDRTRKALSGNKTVSKVADILTKHGVIRGSVVKRNKNSLFASVNGQKIELDPINDASDLVYIQKGLTILECKLNVFSAISPIKY